MNSLVLNRRGNLSIKLVAPMQPGYPATVFFTTLHKVVSVELDGVASRLN